DRTTAAQPPRPAARPAPDRRARRARLAAVPAIDGRALRAVPSLAGPALGRAGHLDERNERARRHRESRRHHLTRAVGRDRIPRAVPGPSTPGARPLLPQAADAPPRPPR